MRMLVLAIAPGCREVDDVVQESCVAMWRKIDDFDTDRDFMPWALTFVRFQTMAWLKRKGRDKVSFSNEIVESLCSAIGSSAQWGSEKADALELCLEGLSEDDRQLLTLRFVDGLKVPEIAKQKRQKSTEALYKTFSKVKASLVRCVEAKMEEAGNVA